MNIPEKAVEAAAYALDDYWGGRYAPHALKELSDEMRAVLVAAAPFISAEALRWAADDLDKDHSDPYQAMGRFLTRADELDPPHAPTNS